jgi:hypothetical protein
MNLENANNGTEQWLAILGAFSVTSKAYLFGLPSI